MQTDVSSANVSNSNMPTDFSNMNFQDLINLAASSGIELKSKITDHLKSHSTDYAIILDCGAYPPCCTVKMQSERWPNEFRGSDFALVLNGLNEVIKRFTIANLFPLKADEKRHQNDAEIGRIIVNAFTQREQLRELRFIECGPNVLKEHTALEFHATSVTFERCTQIIRR